MFCGWSGQHAQYVLLAELSSQNEGCTLFARFGGNAGWWGILPNAINPVPKVLLLAGQRPSAGASLPKDLLSHNAPVFCRAPMWAASRRAGGTMGSSGCSAGRMCRPSVCPSASSASSPSWRRRCPAPGAGAGQGRAGLVDAGLRVVLHSAC
jgi:hypothetical protein